MTGELAEVIDDDQDAIPSYLRRAPHHAVPDDPSDIGWSPIFVIELALLAKPDGKSIEKLCRVHDIDQEKWDNLRAHPIFIRDLAAVREALKDDGIAFKIRAQLQAGELLKESWNLIHDTKGDVPPSVKADLIKFTIRAAGFDEAAKGAANAAAVNATKFSIHLHLNDD